MQAGAASHHRPAEAEERLCRCALRPVAGGVALGLGVEVKLEVVSDAESG